MKNSMFFVLLLLRVSFAGNLSITDNKVNFGHKICSDKRKINTIIVHSSFNATVPPDSFSVKYVIEQYRTYNVSAHYLIDREGVIYKLIDEKDIAWHAGKSELPDGTTNVNAVSIGIEIINTYKTPPNGKQYEALKQLILNIEGRYKIKYILGHSDIAPGRKTDPWMFDGTEIFRK